MEQVQRVVLSVGSRRLATYVTPLLELRHSQPANVAKIRTLSADVDALPELEALDVTHMHAPGLFVPSTASAPSTTPMEHATSPHLSPAGVANDVMLASAAGLIRSGTVTSPSLRSNSPTGLSFKDTTPLPPTRVRASTHRSNSSTSSATGDQAPCNFYFILGRCVSGVRFIIII